MKAHLTKLSDKIQFEGTNKGGDKTSIGASVSVGGTGVGTRPMELVLQALASCASIDISLILEKQKQKMTSYEVEVTGVRKDAVPAVFESIHMEFIFSGDLNENKVNRAVDLAVNKYCSVADMIKDKVDITYGIKITD